MLVPIERIIDGVVQTLVAVVLPEVATPFARGQLYAAVDLLQNLRDRVEPRAALLDEEARAATSALASAASALRAARHPGADAAADAVDAACAAAPPAPPLARAERLREALIAAFAAIDVLPADVAAPARIALAQHLATQAMRDIVALKPSLLGEISRG